jgi:TetR/AcrR family transcriptional repressor of nem operon
MSSTPSRASAPTTRRERRTKTEAARVSGEKLLDAAVHVIRSKGYSAARVEDICAEAGLTKGGFFHHFPSKEACAVAAAAHFAARADSLFDAASYARLADPRARVLGYVDFRKAILQGELPEFTCLLGTMVQEAYETHPTIRAACDRYISQHAARLEADLAEAKAICAPEADWTPQSAAFFSQAVLQGAFILAKAKRSPDAAADCLDHLKLYFEGLLPASPHSVGAVADHAAPIGDALSQRAVEHPHGRRREEQVSEQKITPCLWFDFKAEEAVAHYLSIFDHGRVLSTTRYSGAGPGPKGAVMTILFEIEGQRYLALNGGPHFAFTPAISLTIDCATQDEVDRLWERLGEGGKPGQCGWLQDKFGLSWQIVPSIVSRVMESGDAAAIDRLVRAVLPMTKLDISKLQQAVEAA